jgi:opacity protein-like surface antigen
VRANVSVLGINVRNELLKDHKIDPKALYEASILSEFNFFRFEPSKTKNSYTPYVFAGIGAVNFKYFKITPKIEFQTGQIVSPPAASGVLTWGGVQDNMRRGYRHHGYEFYDAQIPIISSEIDSDPVTKAVIPFGAGFKYNLKGVLSLDTHISYRLAITNVLDDEFGGNVWHKNIFKNINNFDSYMTFQIGITYTFFKQGCPTW